MADYYLNLGFTWNSPPIGSTWSTESMEYRFLQYALADADGRPAWFQFEQDDNLYVQLWDLSSEGALSASGLDMSLSALDAPSTLDPATLLDLRGSATVQSKAVGDRSNEYLQFSSFNWSYNRTAPYTSPWGPCRGKTSPIGPVSFIRQASFKLSFYLAATADRTTQVFISDPEVIVGSRG